jgi:CHAT domain-containing protein/tetratricopeptide (TPR) repeat protein
VTRPPAASKLCLAIVVTGVATLWSRQARPPEDMLDPQNLLASGSYEQAEAGARAQVENIQRIHGDASLEAAIAADVLVQALLLNGKGALGSTLALAERTLQFKEDHLRSGHPDLVPSLLNLGDVRVATADYARAIAGMERAVALREPGAGVGLAEALDHLGTALNSAGRYDAALRALERSLRLEEVGLRESDVRIARTLEAIAFALQSKGEYKKARPQLERAARIQEEANRSHPDYAETLNLLGQQLWFEGKLSESRQASLRAIALAERTLRADHPTIALSLRYLAGTALDLGDVAEARSLLQRALAITERNFGPSHFQTAEYLHDLARTTQELGDYPTARKLFERSLRIMETRFGPWHDFVATAQYNVALVDASLGDYAVARRELQRAATIWERVFGRDHPFVALALTDLAVVLRQQGSPADALPVLDRALIIRERSLGPGHRDVARTLADLAATLIQLGRVQRAQALASRALRIWEALDEPDAPDFATALALYADLQSRRGDNTAARQYYERALAIRERGVGRAHPTFADTQIALASTLANLHEGEAALAAATAGETTAREHLRLTVRYLPERQSLSYAANRPRGLDLVISLIGEAPGASEAAMDALIRARAIVLDEMAARRSEDRAPPGDTAPLTAVLASARQRLANLVVRGPGDLSPERYVALVDAARSESEIAERNLAEQSAAFRAELNRAHVGLTEVSSSLPTGSALVSFVRYRRTVFHDVVPPVPSNPHPRLSPKTVSSYLAFVLLPNRPPTAVTLGPASAVDALVTRWREDIATEPFPAVGARAAPRSSRVSGAALRRLVWDPLAGNLTGASRIFVVPDGALSLVPFAALPVGQRFYLLEQAAVIHYLSTERDLVPVPEAPVIPGKGLLALGGAAFDDPTVFSTEESRPRSNSKTAANTTASVRAAESACGSFQTVKFQPLTGTLQEVRDIATLWNASGDSGAEGAQMLVGRDASERAFKQEAHHFRVLHLATHGFFLGDSCSLSRSGTRAVGGLASKSHIPPAARHVDNPLLLSGLALAGANRRSAAGPQDDDGILTAEEVAVLNLQGTEWAVLSACDTGIGEIKAGEGVFGLRRAFQVAGVHTVIMSLWSVEDRAVVSWMRVLYEARLQKKLSTAEAVREASLAVLQHRRLHGKSTHPFFWAGFVAAGDWR